MAYIRCGGGGDSAEPTFSRTVLCDNSESLSLDLVLSDDYDKYDFLEFTTYCSSESTTVTFITTPEILTDIVTYCNGFCFNEVGTNHYIWFYITDKTHFTRQNSRYLTVTKVVGVNCTNYTVDKTEIYARKTWTGSRVQVTSQDSFFDYDYLFFATCDGGDNSATMPTIHPIQLNLPMMDIGVNFVVNKYSDWNAACLLDEHTLSSQWYYYVQGIKFI